MSNPIDKTIPSTGAVPKTRQNNKKCSQDQNKYRGTEVGTSVVQSGSGDFLYELPLGDQAAGPELITKKTRCNKRYQSVSFAFEGESSSKKAKYDPAHRKHECRIFQNSCMEKQKKNWLSQYTRNQIDDEIASTSAGMPSSKKPRLNMASDTNEDVNMDSADGENEKDADAESNNLEVRRKKPKHSNKCIACAMRVEHHEEIVKIIREDILEDQLTAELESLHIKSNQIDVQCSEKTVPARPKLSLKNREHKLRDAALETDMNSNVSVDFSPPKVVTWSKERWNKDNWEASSMSNKRNAVVVHNLPMEMITMYHEKLAEVFGKHGHIKHIGAAERLSDTIGEVFNTTIYFETEEAASKAVEEVCFYGSGIHVSRPLTATETTAFPRSYSLLPTAEMRDIFEDAAAGPPRCVRAGKRRSSRMAVAFLKFDGPEAVERAVAISGTVQVNGKSVYVNKFEVRDKNRKPGKATAPH